MTTLFWEYIFAMTKKLLIFLRIKTEHIFEDKKIVNFKRSYFQRPLDRVFLKQYQFKDQEIVHILK